MSSFDAPTLLIHLSGPLQSWGTRSRYNQRDTEPFPTRSGLIGLIAAALGRPRQRTIDDLIPLRFTIRTDRPGVLLRDFHTVGGNLPRKHTVATAEGKRRSPGKTTVVSHRYYLTDAVFTVAITAPPQHADLIAECHDALARPYWPPYLGRRSCPPAGPLVLAETDDPHHWLTRLPLARRKTSGDSVSIDVHSDSPTLPGSARLGDVTDEPEGFHNLRRRYRRRGLYRTTLTAPADLCGGYGTEYLTALTDYLKDRP